MKMPALALGALVLLFAFLASPALAQYIYLDSNGDGVHTSADVLHGVGPTVVDIWLDTGHNRDGSVTHCSAGTSTPNNMFSYEVTIRATGGTLSWSSYTNRISQMSFIGSPHAPDETRFVAGDFYTPLGVSLPPDRYRLGTFTANVLSGTPSLDFVGLLTWQTQPFEETFTGFGSNCDGTDFANTIVLGTDWFDQDGLAFDPGGTGNGAPVLATFPDPQTRSGENLTQVLSASDPDGQPLSFSKAGGPGYMFVVTTDPGSGTARGELRLAPFASDIGVTPGAVSVTDGIGVDSKTFPITVAPSSGHPPVLFPVPAMTVIAGRVGSLFLGAGDPDGDLPHFALTSGPPYASVHDLASREGGASAKLVVSPGLCDVGAAVARVSVSDGTSSVQQDVRLTVVEPTLLPDALVHMSPAGGIRFIWGIASADMDRDGKLDAVIGYEGDSRVSVMRGLGGGLFGAPVDYSIPSGSYDVAAADLDENGTIDVVSANTAGASASVLLGRGDGTLQTPVTYATGSTPSRIKVADFNRDGVPDLVTNNEASNTVSVLLGVGDGTFLPKRDSPTGLGNGSLAIADFNLDGRLDVAVRTHDSGTTESKITVLPGLGDGSFGTPIHNAVSSYPLALAAADWNGDGLPDVVSTTAGGPVSLLAGRGDGTFAPPVVLGRYQAYDPVGCDLDGDGVTDLAFGDVDSGAVIVFIGHGDGTFVSPPSVLRGIGPKFTLGDMNGDGRSDFIASAGFGLGVLYNRFGPANPALTRAFLPSDNRSIASGGSSDLVILVEPQAASYTNDMLDFSSVTLGSDGTGSASLIHSLPGKKLISADRDNDGIPEVGVTFAKADVASLFNQLHGRSTVVADLAGSLTDGRAFCTDVTLTIVGKAATTLAAATFAPNPLNPTSKLTFATERDGAARVMIFDLQGRRVRTLLDVGRLPAGPHEYRFDGKTDWGVALSSGVYFYRVESVGGKEDGQIIILK